MLYALSRKSMAILRELTESKALLAFDFDGTLAPIVDDPAQARMRSGTQRLLGRLASAYPCVVISGRSRADLRDKLTGTGIRRTIGNHGAEPWEGAAALRDLIARWNAVLMKELLPLRGVSIENKEFSVTVHYRQSRSKAKAHSQILKTALSLPGARLICGKQAISIVSEDAPNKGTALRAEMDRRGCDRALYVGDDETDEDVFALDGGLRLMAIRVGQSRKSRAAYFIRGQREIDDLLRVLLS